jgi:putative Mg2+ transporter-C (MgtC) family protein
MNDGTEHLTAVASFERLAVALVLGFVIGLEREWRQGMAGLHTVTLVAVGAALFTMLPVLLGMTGDPTRVAAQVVTGIGFLAGGVILREGLTLRGLITAATLWATAAIGVLAGSGFFEVAAVGTIVIVGINLLFRPIADAMARRAAIQASRKKTEVRATTFTLDIACAPSAGDRIREVVFDSVDRSTLSLRSLRTTMPTHDIVNVTLKFRQPGFERNSIEKLIKSISSIDDVTSVTWEAVEEPV